jgi:uncharacterized protein (DUF952 family)
VATEPLFHLALRRDWEAAVRSGEYRVSTLGRTLEQEGYVHASYRHQVQGVRDGFYADAPDDLVLLEIDPGLVGVPVVVEVPDGGAEAFPHLYGPLPTRAVVAAHPVAGRDVWAGMTPATS